MLGGPRHESIGSVLCAIDIGELYAADFLPGDRMQVRAPQVRIIHTYFGEISPTQICTGKIGVVKDRAFELCLGKIGVP